jgi:hypothetical protein
MRMADDAPIVMPGLVRLVPGIHDLQGFTKAVDARDKPCHDETGTRVE